MTKENKGSSIPTPPPITKRSRMYTMPEQYVSRDTEGGHTNRTWLVLLVIILAVAALGFGAYVIMNKMNAAPPDTTNEETELENENAANVNTGVNTANANAATNANTNSAANHNATSNVNGTANLNNLNIFPNSNTNQPINVPPVNRATDADQDALTDGEEALYKTNVTVADSDGDSFADGQEVVNGYNPAGAGTLSSTTAVRLYTDPNDGYSVLYPSSWVIADDPLNERGKMFTTSGEFFSVSIHDNPLRLSAKDWYLSKSPSIDSTKIKSVTNWDKSLQGVLAVDGMTAYYVKGTAAILVTYNTNVLSEASYFTTFEMMYRSLVVTTVPLTNTNGTTNVNSTSNTNTAANSNANGNSNTSTPTNGNYYPL